MATHRSTLELALSAETLDKLLQSLASQDEIKTGLSLLSRKVDRINEIQSRVEMDDRRRKVVSFFLKVNPQPNFQTSMRLRQPLTGLWLTESNQTYQKWRDIPSSSLWLSGIPGAGKTVLCGVVIDDVLQMSNESTAVAFYFCDYKNHDSQQLVNILGAIAVQLSQQNEEAFSLLEDQFTLLNPSGGLPKEPEAEMLMDLISRLSSLYEKVFLVVDGVDECGAGMGEVAAELRQLSEGCRPLSLAIFSRDEQEINEEVSENFAHIEIAAHSKDIDLYVCAEMGKRRQLKKMRLQSPDLAEEIREKLVTGAQGMFRWVACQLDYLCELTTNRARREALSSLPPTLPETYHRILLRILGRGPEITKLVRKSLHWISLDRNLSLHELCQAVSIADSNGLFVSDDDLVDVDYIAEECRSFVRKRQWRDENVTKDYIEFAHFTVEEYLRSIDPDSDVGIFRLDDETALTEFSMICLRSVLMTKVCFNKKNAGNIEFLKSITGTFFANPFYYYSIRMLCGSSSTDDKQHNIIWIHIEKSLLFEAWSALFGPEKSTSFVALAFGALFGRTFRSPAASELLVPDGDRPSESSELDNVLELFSVVLVSDFTPLKFAAAVGLPRLWSAVFQRPMHSLYQTAQSNLCCAIVGSRIFVPEKLLDTRFCNWYQIDSCEELRTRAITQILSFSVTSESAIEVTPEWPQSGSSSPLSYAITERHGSVVETLLKNDLNLSSKQINYINQLLDGPFNVDDGILRSLAENQSPAMSSFPILRSLFQTPNEEDTTGDSSWEWDIPPSVHLLALAILRNDEQLCKGLFNSGISAEAELPGCIACPMKPLFFAIENFASYYATHVLDIILERANLDDSQCRKHALGLRNAILLGIWHKVPTKTLRKMLDESLRQGSYVMDSDLNPFHVAALSQSSSALFQLKAHVETNFHAYRELYRCIPWAKLTSWKDFLAAAASRVSRYSSVMDDKWPFNSEWSASALHYAVEIKNQQCIESLIDCGADLDARDNYQMTPLTLAANVSNFEAVQSLLAAGADPFCCDEEGMTALMWAVEYGSMEMVELLANTGLDLVCDNYGLTALHRARLHESLAPKIFSYLQSRGFDPLYHPAPMGLSAVTYSFYGGTNTELETLILNSGLLYQIDAEDSGNPLAYAAQHGDGRLLRNLWRLFNRCGAVEHHLHRGTYDGHTPLCSAAIRGFDSCLDELLSHGANMDHEGCSQGSALMSAVTYCRLEATKKLVRSGASISYTNNEGVYRNAFEAGKRHSDIRKWFLVGRFQDQDKLTADSHWGDNQGLVKEWSGGTRVEWRLTGANRRRHDESRFDYLCRIQHIKKEARGRVMMQDVTLVFTGTESR
ncbi:ankyrin repeat protein [Colletotrichum chrysophilum]|uniref:Ankyrin repeat protein n=1 Tax=Colletotrichum chrysophilum TaxID=1836956 RepID=A0AAD9A861_9PEZI|nr:ankyrin repeat protein [Colletotrichum chrysophilum]